MGTVGFVACGASTELAHARGKRTASSHSSKKSGCNMPALSTVRDPFALLAGFEAADKECPLFPSHLAQSPSPSPKTPGNKHAFALHLFNLAVNSPIDSTPFPSRPNGRPQEKRCER